MATQSKEAYTDNSNPTETRIETAWTGTVVWTGPTLNQRQLDRDDWCEEGKR